MCGGWKLTVFGVAGCCAADRIREQTLNSLTRSMVEAMRHHHIVKTESADKAREKCLRRAKLVWPDMDEEELAERMSENPTGMFQAGVQQSASSKMKRAYNEAKDRAKVTRGEIRSCAVRATDD